MRHTMLNLMCVLPIIVCSGALSTRAQDDTALAIPERIADAFIVGDYELMSQPDNPYWSAKPDITREHGEDLYRWAAREYQPYCKGKTRLYLFSEWLSDIEPQTRFFAEMTCKYSFDGIDVHEAANFETPPTNMALLKAMSDRLQGDTAQ